MNWGEILLFQWDTGGNPIVPTALESIYHIPVTHGGISLVPTVPAPSSMVTSFNWSRLVGYRLPPYVPFQIIVQSYNVVVPRTIIDEGASCSIMSSTAWKYLGSPYLVPVIQNLLAFNRGTSELLGILPNFPITLG